ncbi:MAG: hypothetical protein ACYCX2_01295 [Christensenellales bacterium]
MQPDALALEMLLRESALRSFVLSSKSMQGKPPKLVKEDDGWVAIDFSGAEVLLNGTPAEVFAPIKAKYKEKIKGNVTCLVKYEMMLASYYITFDFETG